jgi:hypothetical protein
VTVAELTRLPERLAGKTGKCPGDCGDPIVKGKTYIAKAPRKGWMHSQCAYSYLHHLELFAELNRDDDEAPGSPAGPIGGDE